ncbi:MULTISPECIES: MmcQ/YjbR family DNA-binding protein [Rhodomicrobium]|uniref:MmcQ/YjbR family DNA-binding protein n=1 Tax=Rhodomicrobium TaxID=1068 RepID=UPI000B4B47E5|nr:MULTISPECIES: MmcQ/YjbR family DNA-binding protein [Rhodomicrobium]
MTEQQFNAFCAGLPATAHVVQWRGAQVWKVGGKVFAIGRWPGGAPGITFKVTPLSFEMLKDQPGLRPAPYLASRGMSWIQHYAAPGLTDAELQDRIRQSHRIVAQGLSRKQRAELGILEPGPGGAE